MKLSAALLAPYWFAQLFTGAKSFLDNPLIGSSRLNAMGLHTLRVRAAHYMTTRRRAALASSLCHADKATFDRDGVVEVRDFLPVEHFQMLRDEVRAFKGPARETIQGDTITRRLALDAAARAAIPAFDYFQQNSRWRGLAHYVAGFDRDPLLYLQSILPGRHDAPADPQLEFHSDTFHPSMKAWLFLEDVPIEAGPFAYVRGSHRLTPARLAWERERSMTVRDGDCRLSARGSFRISSAELTEMGFMEPAIFAVPANTLIVADTVGFHARTRATTASTRVEIWAYGRRNPFSPTSGIDLWRMTGLSDQRVPLRWWLRDKADPIIRQPWKPVGMKGVADE